MLPDVQQIERRVLVSVVVPWTVGCPDILTWAWENGIRKAQFESSLCLNQAQTRQAVTQWQPNPNHLPGPPAKYSAARNVAVASDSRLVLGGVAVSK